ncbi:MAG: hypothetical protein HC877_19150 [Thioploca sp.]|nr:hypothetical protein [Thioploca sp.]
MVKKVILIQLVNYHPLTPSLVRRGKTTLNLMAVTLQRGNNKIIGENNSMKRLSIFLIIISLTFPFLNGQVYADSIEATDIKLNTEYNDRLSTEKEVDFFKFNLPADGNVIVTFRHEELSDNANVHWNVYLYSEADIELPLGSMAIKATDRKASFSTGIGAGTYLIKITPQYYNNNSDVVQYWWDDQYFLAVNFEESDFYEKSPNHDPNQATMIELNTEYSANLAPKGDVDFFTFSLPVDGKVNLSFRHSELGGSDTYWNIYLYEEKNLEAAIKSIAIKGSEQSVSSGEVPINAGLYFIKITPQYYTGVLATGSDVRYWWWDQYFLKVQTDVAQPVCPQVITYGKNPVSGNWISFPTPCDVPENWVTQNTKPDGACPACPVEVACPEPEVTVCPEPEVTTCPEPETNTTIAATLSPTFELHIPDVQHEGMSFWADLVNVPSSDENLLFQVTDYGQN